MPRQLRRQFEGAKYHVTNRGNGRQAIFADACDCERFLVQLAEAVRKDRVILYAYCLMPNHFHLFVETPQANLGRFMGRLTTAYAMYWRRRHRKPGHCFQNRYNAPLIEGSQIATWAQEQGKRRRKSDVTLPAGRVVDIGRIERAVCAECGIQAGALRRKGARLGLAREFAVELGCSVGGLTQRAMAERLGGVTEHAVGKVRQRLLARLKADNRCRRRFERLKEAISSV